MRPVFGITGGTGSGKTTALQILESMGFTVLDCDAVYHEMLRSSVPMLTDLGRAFPGVVENGILQRKKLGSYVFSNEAQLKKLNQTVWPHIVAEVQGLLDREPDRPFAIDAIGLTESGLGDLCTVTVAVTAPLEDRVVRLMAREGIPADYARLRIQAQKSDEDFRQSCDYTLNNNFPTKEAFGEYCIQFFQRIFNDI